MADENWCTDGMEHDWDHGVCLECHTECCTPETIDGKDVHGPNCRAGVQ